MGELKIKGPRARAAELRERFRLTAGDVAQATRTDERTVRRWTSSTEARRSPADDRIRALERVVEALIEAGVGKESVRTWLREPADFLDHRSPLAALGDGNVELVEQFVDVSTLGISVGRTARGGNAPKRTPKRAVAHR
jgi:uncharacterized protein (DUF2384 family)